jgi:hypothetical protein
MLDPVARSIVNAPFEDEEINAETAAELDASIARGEGIPDEEIMRQYAVSRNLANAPVEDQEIGEDEEQRVVADLGSTMDQVRNHGLEDERETERLGRQEREIRNQIGVFEAGKRVSREELHRRSG